MIPKATTKFIYESHFVEVKCPHGAMWNGAMDMDSTPFKGNGLALPIDKLLYIYLLCPHSEHQKKICSNLNSLNTFSKETGSPNVKLILIR
jgi:hypothetical protein